MPRLSGVTTETVKRLWFDAGATYIDYGEATERLLGATRGGASFVIEQDVREMPVDGLPGPVKGFRRVIEVRARLTVNILEMTAANFAMILGGAEIADYPEAPAVKTHDSVKRSRIILPEDYLTNVALVGQISGSDDPAIAIIQNALADGNLELTTTDREEPALEVQFTAHFSNDPDEFDFEPWEIRIPIAAGS